MLVFEKTLEELKQKKKVANQHFVKQHAKTRRKSLPNEIRLMESTFHSDGSNESKPIYNNSILIEQLSKVFISSCGPIKASFG